MARLGIYTGTAPDAGDGDNLLDGAVKINSNFSEVYTLLGDGTNLLAGIVTSIVAGNNINVSGATGQVTISAGAGGTWANYDTNTGISTTKKVRIQNNLEVTGVCTANSFYGAGTNLSGIVTSIVAGTNVTISGATGQVTINASGGGGGTGYFEQNATGIHTLSNVGIGTTTASSALTVKGNTSLETLNVSGVSTFNNNLDAKGNVIVGAGLSVVGVSTFKNDIKVDYNKTLYFGNGNEFFVYRYNGLPNDKTVVYNASEDLQITSTSGLYIDNGTRTYAVFNNSGTELYHKANDIPAVTLRYQTTDTGTNVYKDFSVKVNNGNDLFVVKDPISGLSADAKVGIGTTNPQTSLQIENVYGVKTGLGTFVASVGIAHTLDSFTISSTDFKTSEYTIHINYNSNIQSQKLLVMQDGTTAYSQEYAIMFDPNIIVSIGATITSGELRLEVTPETGVTGLTTYRFTRQTML